MDEIFNILSFHRYWCHLSGSKCGQMSKPLKISEEASRE